MTHNPWKVDSLQAFSCLKCPECHFFTKEEITFANHGIANHPLSKILFDEKTSILDSNVNKEFLEMPNPLTEDILHDQQGNLLRGSDNFLDAACSVVQVR